MYNSIVKPIDYNFDNLMKMDITDKYNIYERESSSCAM